MWRKTGECLKGKCKLRAFEGEKLIDGKVGRGARLHQVYHFHQLHQSTEGRFSLTAEIICVGNELLYGDTLNTNTQYLSQQLAMIGIEVKYQLVVGDDEPILLDALQLASKRSDIILLSGGLGPTYDDLTKKTVAKALGQPLVLDQPSIEAIKGYFERVGRVMSNGKDKQAYRPSGGVCLLNDNGTAPGIYVCQNQTHYFCLPGPPSELIPMYQAQVKSKLSSLTNKQITSTIYSLAGIGESALVKEIGHIMDHSDNPRIAPYLKTGMVNIRVTAMTETVDEGKVMLETARAQLMPLIGAYVYTETGEDVETVLVKGLKEAHMTIATAESCTGGLMSSRIVNVPGASDVFMNGFITYSNEAKSKLIGVDPTLIGDYGAVSEEVALAMAEGVRKVSESSIGVAITGVAGPTGGSLEKPVGTVYIATAGGRGNIVRRYQFNGNRQKIREISAQYGLVQAFRLMKQFEK